MADGVGQTVPTASTADGQGGGAGGEEKPAVLIIGGLGVSSPDLQPSPYFAA